MNCIICGESINCKPLEEFVRRNSSLNLIGTFCDSVSISNQFLKSQDIELVIFDIDIPDIDVFNLISTINNKSNLIIVSSSDQNALKAFEFNVVDYLLKPVSYSRFCKAVDKTIKYYSRKEVSSSDENEIYIKRGSLLVKLKLEDIVYIEALENYVTLHTKAEKFTIHFTMKAITNYLPSGLYARVHRSFIVNKSMIHAINENSLHLHIGDDLKEIPMGKSYKDSLMNSIDQITK